MAFVAIVDTKAPGEQVPERWMCDHVHRGYEQAVKCAFAQAKRMLPSSRDFKYGLEFTALSAGAEHVIPHDYK